MRLLRVLRAVLWSFSGIRRGADAAQDLERAGPGTLIAAALVLAALFVAAIITVVRFVVPHDTGRQRGEPSAAASGVAPRDARGPVVVRDTMEERVRACTGCHGSATQATRDGFSPRIAGKPAGYLFNQLVSFRDGRRTYPPMVYLVQYMTDDYLREMAEYFSALELPYPAAEPSSLAPAGVERARQIVEHGDLARRVPACVACHGAQLSGVTPAIPGLLGLPRQYVTAQFGAWRQGRLRSAAPDCMAEVAGRLAEEDIQLLASWLAAQPVAAGMKPAPASGPLPMDCAAVHTAPTAAHASEPGAERGRYLVAAGDCIACHTRVGGAPYAGGRAIATPFGTVYSSNITPDRATGIGAWSREDFWRALHEGRSKEGRLLYPAFPYPNFTRVTREDADAMYDYLRTLPPVSQANTPHAVRFPYNTQAALWGWRALFFRAGVFQPEPGRGEAWNRGAYLVRALGHCDACHAGRNIFGAVSHSLDLGGGLIPMQNWYAPPLTAGPSAAVAGWEEEQIVELLRSGVSPRGMAMGPMAEVVYRSTQHLLPADARAIAAYLRESRPNVEPEQEAAARDERVMAGGSALYQEHCAGCHGDRGEGAHPAYPALAGNPTMNGPLAANAIKAVLSGGYPPVTSANPRPYGMPPYFGRLSDAEVAAVLTYARGSWGNEGAPVSALDVERFR